MANDYLLALDVEPFTLGQSFVPGQPLPLHCTLMHWFQFREGRDFSHLDREISSAIRIAHYDILSCMRAQHLISDQAALFGPKNDVPVHTLERTNRLFHLHIKIFNMLKNIGVRHSELRWVGENWRPHVTTTDRAFEPGSEHMATTIAVIARTEEKQRSVIAVYELPS